MKSSKVFTQHKAPQEPPFPSQGWTQIDADTTVEVRYPSGYSYQAIVDEKSPDSSTRKHLARARTRTAQIDTAELKSIESAQAVMS